MTLKLIFHRNVDEEITTSTTNTLIMSTAMPTAMPTSMSTSMLTTTTPMPAGYMLDDVLL